jgi:hypothetical protein
VAASEGRRDSDSLEPAPVSREVGRPGSQLDVAEAVHPCHFHLQGPVLAAAADRGWEPGERSGVDGTPEGHDSPTGRQVGGSRRQYVTTGEGRSRRSQPIPAVFQLDCGPGPAEGVYRGDHQAVVRTYERDTRRPADIRATVPAVVLFEARPTGLPRLDRDAPTRRPHPGVNNGQDDAVGQVWRRPLEGQAACPYVVGCYPVREVDQCHLGHASTKDTVHGPDKTVFPPVVGEQADRRDSPRCT